MYESPEPPTLTAVKHMRTKGGRHEVDLIIERADGRILAVEVKLSGTVSDHDVRHLVWLRDRLGRDGSRTAITALSAPLCWATVRPA